MLKTNIENKEKVDWFRKFKEIETRSFQIKEEKTKFILSSFNEFTNYKRGEINTTFRDNNLIDVKKYEKVED